VGLWWQESKDDQRDTSGEQSDRDELKNFLKRADAATKAGATQ